MFITICVSSLFVFIHYLRFMCVSSLFLGRYGGEHNFFTKSNHRQLDFYSCSVQLKMYVYIIVVFFWAMLYLRCKHVQLPVTTTTKYIFMFLGKGWYQFNHLPLNYNRFRWFLPMFFVCFLGTIWDICCITFVHDWGTKTKI